MENEIIVTEVLLPEKYSASQLMDLYVAAHKKVNTKALHAREHFSGFAAAYQVVTLIILVLHLFIKSGFVETSYQVLVGDHFFVWLPCYFFLSRIDKIFSSLCKRFGIFTDNPYCDKKFFHLLGLYLFADELYKDHRIIYDTISYTIKMEGDTSVSFSGLYAAVDGINDFGWLDREVDKFVKKAK